MPQLLLILGALLALVGLGSIAAGAPDWVLGLSLGATLIQSGTIAFVGGLILIGLGLVLYVLQDLVQRLDAVKPGAAPATRPAMLPPGEQAAAQPRQQAAGPRQGAPGEGQQRPREREAAPASDAEQAGQREQTAADQPRGRRERRDTVMEEMEEQIAAARGASAAGDPARQRRERPRDAHPEEFARPRRQAAPPPLDDEAGRPRRQSPPPQSFPGDDEGRPRQRTPENTHEEIPRVRAERPREQHEDAPARPPRREFAPIPPIPQPFGGEGRRAPEPSREGADQPAPRFRPPESAPPRPGSETVVRSGVIGGMAYTLYVDGSIEAELPIGTVRFNSIAELQDHVMRTGAEADGDFEDSQR